jgi:serine/threonine-protein kinase
MSSPEETVGAAGRRVGRYMLFGELASGGIGSVHMGTVSAPGGFKKLVAIKRLHPQYRKDSDFSARFLEEARLSARIAHANVVQTLDVVEASGEVLLVMEYVHGEALNRLLQATVRSGEAVPIPIAAAILAAVLHGLAAAHATCDANGQPLGLVHRDVSPQNILVGVDGTARLLDFGIARALGQRHVTPEGEVRGKIGYMAPEQLSGEPLTARADLYACSVVLWELLTGRRLFLGESEAVTLARVLSYTAPPPSEFRPEIPVALNRVVLRGLARNPALRYDSATAMAAALEGALPIASPATLAAWVRRLAEGALARRAEACAACERASDELPLVEPRARRRPFAGGLAILALLSSSVAVAVVAPRWRASTPPAPPSAVAITSGQSAESSSAASPSAVPRAITGAPGEGPSAAGAPTPGPSATTSSAAPGRAVNARSVRREDCNPPWVLDPDGRKRFKRQCL